MEQWKTFLEYDNRCGHTEYQVSTEGRIRNCKTGKYKIPVEHGDGYKIFRAKSKGINFNKLVHRIVAETFIPNPDNKPSVDHINGDKTDNRVENLRWVTAKENMSNPITRTKIKNGLTKVPGKEEPYKKTSLTLLLEKIVPL